MAGGFVDALYLLVEGTEFHLQDSSLNRIKTGIHTNTHIVVLVCALTMYTIGIHQLRPLVVVGKHCPTVTVAAQRLGGEE